MFMESHNIKDKINDTDRVVMDKKEITSPKFPVEQKESSYKPSGLWYALGEEWINWCKSEMPEWMGEYIYKLDIDMSKVLHIKNSSQLKIFTNEYKNEKSYHEYGSDCKINWKKVSENYNGIEISPYLYDMRMKYMWYYGWDVASGCIWNENVIKTIKRVKV